MFDLNKFYDWKKESSGDDTAKINLFSVHFNRLSVYHEDWNLKKRMIYEYMLICARKFGSKGDDFFRKLRTIAEETMMSPNTAQKYIEELEEEGYLNVERKEKNGVKKFNQYRINYEYIKNSFREIYDFEGMEEEDIKFCEQQLAEWYDYHSADSYRDANKPTDIPAERVKDEPTSITA